MISVTKCPILATSDNAPRYNRYIYNYMLKNPWYCSSIYKRFTAICLKTLDNAPWYTGLSNMGGCGGPPPIMTSSIYNRYTAICLKTLDIAPRYTIDIQRYASKPSIYRDKYRSSLTELYCSTQKQQVVTASQEHLKKLLSLLLQNLDYF